MLFLSMTMRRIMVDITDYIKIGRVAERCRVTAQTIRKWEQKGRIKSERHPISNARYYKSEDVERLVKEVFNVQDR